MLHYINGGNFLPLESGPSAKAKKYRQRMKQWSARYKFAAKKFNAGADIVTEIPMLKNRPTSDFLLPGVSIRDDQYAPITAGINFGRGAMFLGMGRGKTFIGGYLANYLQRYAALKNEFPDNKFLVLCPKSVIGEWVDQVGEFFDCTISAFPTDPAADTDIVVTNYEQLHKLLPRKEEFGGIILDESQRAKNMGTKTFEILTEFMDLNIFFRFVLTGTPILNKPDDMFTQLSIINPYAFDFSYDYMKSRYFKSTWIPKGRFYKESFIQKYKAKFHTILNSNSFVLPSTSEDVDIKMHEVECGLSPKQARMLTHVAKGYVTLEKSMNVRKLKGKAKQVELNAAVIKELQISSGFMKAGDDILKFESPKLAKTMEILDNHPGEQFIVWTYFRNTTERLHAAIPNSATVYGDSTDTQRRDAIKAFKEGKLRVLIMQIKSGNTGLNLQICTKMIFAEYDWTPANIDQAIARSARSGQTKQVSVWMLYTRGTADLVMYRAVKNKKKITNSIMTTHITRQLRLARNGAIKAEAA